MAICGLQRLHTKGKPPIPFHAATGSPPLNQTSLRRCACLRTGDSELSCESIGTAETGLEPQLGFNQRCMHPMVHAQLASIWDTDCAHSDIKAPGTMPKTKTNKPFNDKTMRTSVSAVTVVAVTASSKYMTFTTRK